MIDKRQELLNEMLQRVTCEGLRTASFDDVAAVLVVYMTVQAMNAQRWRQGAEEAGDARLADYAACIERKMAMAATAVADLLAAAKAERTVRVAEVSFLRDALDHIARTAHQSRMQTVRVRWIEARANGALEGKPYVRGQFQEPRNRANEADRLQRQVRQLNAELAELRAEQARGVAA